jgi:hypothetical protein
MHHAAGCGPDAAQHRWFSMSDTKSTPVSAPPSARRSFAAMRHSGFRAQFITFVLAMMADNIEHVISYWRLYQKFRSPALAEGGCGAGLHRDRADGCARTAADLSLSFQAQSSWRRAHIPAVAWDDIAFVTLRPLRHGLQLGAAPPQSVIT